MRSIVTRLFGDHRGNVAIIPTRARPAWRGFWEPLPATALEALRKLRSNARGLAAIEFAFIAGFLSLGLLNVTDISVYLYDQLQVNEATQMGAQIAWKTCNSSLPATVNCSTLNSVVTSAIQSTSLGTSVSLNGSVVEGYYCVNTAGALQLVGAVSSAKPADCSAAGVSTSVPADYLKVLTTYSYSPLFSGLSAGSILPTSITATSWARLG